MLILGVEAAAGLAGAAVIRDGKLLAEIAFNNKKTHSQTLLPMIEQVLREADVRDGELIDGIAVTEGPGSFTGLRIGSATVMGLAYAWKKPILSIPSMDACALMAYGYSGVVCPIMDARRNQVFTALYTYDKEADGNFPASVKIGNLFLNRIMEIGAMDIGDLVKKLNQDDKPVAFLGDGVAVHREYIQKELMVPYIFMPAVSSMSRAGAVAELGEAYLEADRCDDAFTHSPRYYRQSQAERVRDERKNS